MVTHPALTNQSSDSRAGYGRTENTVSDHIRGLGVVTTEHTVTD